jgi:EF-P beta-lysylation protein EpmB
MLLKRIGNHEMPLLTVAIEVLHFHIDDIGSFQGLAGLECSLDDTTRLQISKPYTIEGLSFPRLYELVLYDRTGITVEHHLQSALELVGADQCHQILANRSIKKERHYNAWPTYLQAIGFFVNDTSNWQRELADSYRDPLQLLSFLELPPMRMPKTDAAGDFPFRVTQSFAARMKKGDPADPLLKQVLPSGEEFVDFPGFVADPVGDRQAIRVQGILQKYAGRALLVAVGSCAIHCRYCFRRNFPYAEQQLTHSAELRALRWIAGDSSVQEVILSGGDPLLLSDRRLKDLMSELAAIPHVRRVRIHSRIPVVLPSRITEDFVATLTSTRLQSVVVIHANHPNEWDDHVGQALRRLRVANVALLNQAVLLRGINDDVDVLARLSERFFESGVLPYYLHLLDRARGTSHFEVSETDSLAVYEQLRQRLPGYLVPRLVREEPGRPYKTVL